MSFIADLLGYVARGLFSAYEFEGGFWVLFIKALLS